MEKIKKWYGVLMGSITEQNKAYASLFIIFADLFKYPEKENYNELLNGEIDKQIEQLSRLAGHPIITSFKDEIGSYEEIVQAFNDCFLGITTPFAPPVESVYKVWTTDDSFQVPLKNQKGHLLGDSALHIRHIVQALGLEIPTEYEMMPDHLTILLELYSYLNQEGLISEAEQFKKDHLDWLPDFYNSLIKIERNQPYSNIVLKLNEVLKQ